MQVPQKVKNRTTYYPGTTTDTKILIRRDTRTLMFIAALSTTAKLWKELWHPVTDECIKKKCYICTMEYYSPIKMNEILPFAIHQWGKRVYAKGNKSEKDECHVISLICGISETKQVNIWEGQKKEREANHKRLLMIENKLRVDGWKMS